MSLDAILSQLTGGMNWKQLSIEVILKTAIVVAVGALLIKLILRTVDKVLSRHPSIEPLRRTIRSALSIILWILVGLVALGTLGVNMSSIIALLSVAGLAVSLALQNTLSNLAGGIMVLASRPFSIGDYVDVDDVSGTVSMVGLVYCTLVTVENKEIYIPNSQVSSAKIINYTRLGKRRFELTFSTSYNTPTQAVKDALWEAIGQFPQILDDPQPVIYLSAYNTSSIDYLVRAWTTTDDYWDTYYAFLEAVRPAFDRHGVEMPYPQLDVHLIPPAPKKADGGVSRLL